MKIKAISIRQPWASFIAHGPKSIETRKWKTKYRGRLLIVSSMKVDKHLSDFTKWAMSQSASSEDLLQSVGAALAICKLVECRPMTWRDEIAAMCELYPGAQAWVLEEIVRIKPFGVKGKLGVFDVEIPDVEDHAEYPDLYDNCYQNGVNGLMVGESEEDYEEHL